MSQKKRYTLGVLIGGVHTSFPKKHISGIIAAAKELNVNTCFFLGTRTKDFFGDILDNNQQSDYDYQFKTIHDYSRISGVDGLIIDYGTLGFYLKDKNPEHFVRRFHSVPSIFLSEVVHAPDCLSLICDNRDGISQIMEHLILEHHCRKILFVSGPEYNTDAVERREAYFDAMKRYGLLVTPKMLTAGDFSGFVDEQVDALLEQNPDAEAIVFSNDQMASAGYRVCRRRKLKIGTDILITGFDDSEEAAAMTPPLTTVLQDGIQMGKMAVYDLVELLNGRAASSRRVPVSLVTRKSCGCLSQEEKCLSTPMDLADEVHRLNGIITQMKQELVDFQRKSWFLPLLARNLNDCRDDEYAFYQTLMDDIRELHSGCSYLFLLDEPLIYHEEDEWRCPERLKLTACCKNGKVTVFHPSEQSCITRENGGFYPLMDDGRYHQFMTFLLFSGERQYGLLSCDITEEAFPLFYVVSLQIGLSLHFLEINKENTARRLTMSNDIKNLRKQNQTLDAISVSDELTGLLNLRGFLERVQRLCRVTKEPRNAYMIYGDLDHLKEINDTWGHSEGNYALMTTANILKSCVNDNDILARIGGDEFACLILSDDNNFASDFRRRIRLAGKEQNKNSCKPYYVELSLGILPFSLSGAADIDQIMRDADHRLYEAKKDRRASVQKNCIL